MKTPHETRFDDLLPSYALGALEGDELRELKHHLGGGCPKCEQELDRLRRDLELLAETVDPVVPSATTRKRVLKTAAEGAGAETRLMRPSRWAVAAAAAGVILLGWAVTRELQLRFLRSETSEVARLRVELAETQESLATSQRLMARAESDLDRTSAELERASGQVEQAQSQLLRAQNELEQSTKETQEARQRLQLAELEQERQVEELEVVHARLQDFEAEVTRLSQQLVSLRLERDRSRAILASRDRVTEILVTANGSWIRLAGLEAAPAASALVFVNRDTGQAVLFGSGLPTLDTEKDYQLWSIADGPPDDAGVFRATAGGEATHVIDRVRSLDKITTWAVTIEPAGGVPQPTGDMILAGTAG